MSRTYRRTKKTPCWVSDVKARTKTSYLVPLWEYRSDSFNCHPWNEDLKYYTNRRRRSDERYQLHQLTQNEHYDEYDKEKEYLGYVWMFD